MKNLITPICMVWICLAACSPEPEGLRSTPAGNGPMVVWDLEALPLPEIPFPNDAATRLDPDSPTGLRLNLSLIADTDIEAEVRSRADALDGFGTFGPIWLSFDAPLYLEGLKARHADNRDFSDDAVFLVDVTPDSPTYGVPVMLDMGRGFFPLGLKTADAYFPNDPREQGTNLAFETYDEEGGADTDFDGVQDVPNVATEGEDPWDDLLTHYERETDTLLIRPVVPLRERTRYAVVITRRTLGRDGTGAACKKDSDCGSDGSCHAEAKKCREPIRSPFDWVNHTRQTPALEPLADILPESPIGLSTDDVAFAWVFTTQSVTSTLMGIRNGLYGEGPLSRLAGEFPAIYTLARTKTDEKAEETGSATTVTLDEIMAVAGPLLPMLSGGIPSLGDSMDVLMASYSDVAVLVAGTFQSPDFLTDRDGIAAPGFPADDDESFEVDPEKGTAVYGSGKVPFICIIPEELPDYQDKDFPRNDGRKPFPVAIFMHGTASSKLQSMGFGGFFARYGVATCAIDAFAHGMPFPANPPPGSLMSEETVRKLIDSFAPGYQPLYDVIKGNRCRDLNMDGNLDPAGDFWTMDPFHTRDTVRQSVVDLMQFIRILRAMDGKNKADTDGDGKEELLGDFDRDGKPEIGGPDNRYFIYGISLGGIVSSVLAGSDPALDAAVLIVPGGGLADVAVRSTNPGVPEMAIMPMMGPIYVGDPDPENGGYVVSFVMPAFDHVELIPVGRLEKARTGMEVRLTNLDGGHSRFAVVEEGKGFRVQIAADALRATEIRALTGFDPLVRLGGQPCEADADCDGLKCTAKKCGCSGDEVCPQGYQCTGSGLCSMRPVPIPDLLEGDRPAAGDRLRFEVLDAKGKVVETLDTFGFDVTANGAVYPQGATLVNLYRGFGYQRQTPGFRRFMGIAQHVLEPGDPVNWARHLAAEPLSYPSDPAATPGTPAIIIGSVGDTNVPLATAMNLARAAGALGYLDKDGRYGDLSQNDVLVAKGVAEGLYNRCRYTVAVKDKDGKSFAECLLYDADDLDGSRLAGPCTDCTYSYDEKGNKLPGWTCVDPDGVPCGDGFNAPFDLPAPLRATAEPTTDPVLGYAGAACSMKNADGTCGVFSASGGLAAFRLALTKPWGFHGLYLMAPYKPFDVETYQLNLILRFFLTSGTQVWDDPCLEDSSCNWNRK